MTNSSRNDWPPSTNPCREPLSGSVAIVLPMKDGLKFAKLAIYSVLYFTDYPYSFTIVDNQSSLPTAKYLRSLSVNHEINVIRYNEDFNFSAEVNMGLRYAFRSPNVKYGLILNSDVVVEPHWLSQMVDAFAANPKIGIVGPTSNAMMETQKHVRHASLLKTGQIGGACMMFRREVFEQLEGFDESFAGGCFEDLDFCVRAQQRGWWCMVDCRTYVHHYWKCSRRDPIHDEQTRANHARFFAKHPGLKYAENELRRLEQPIDEKEASHA